MKLFLQAISKYCIGLCLFIVLIFIPAGSIHYWNGWLLIICLFIPILIMGIVLYLKAPKLLRKRLNTKEKQAVQKQVIFYSCIIFIGGFISAGLDYRFVWTYIPRNIVYIGAFVLLCSYALYAEVMRENAYLSRSVEVQKDQKIIDTGLYGIIRHPMYTATIFMFLSFPIVLGSWISFCFFLGYPWVIIKRIKNEEEVLEKGLKGYREYKKKVKYRLIPFIW